MQEPPYQKRKGHEMSTTSCCQTTMAANNISSRLMNGGDSSSGELNNAKVWLFTEQRLEKKRKRQLEARSSLWILSCLVKNNPGFDLQDKLPRVSLDLGRFLHILFWWSCVGFATVYVAFSTVGSVLLSAHSYQLGVPLLQAQFAPGLSVYTESSTVDHW